MKDMDGFLKCFKIILLILSSCLIRSTGNSQSVKHVVGNSSLSHTYLDKLLVPKLKSGKMNTDDRHLIFPWPRVNYAYTHSIKKRSSGRRKVLHPSKGHKKKDVISEDKLMDMAAEDTGNPCVVEPCHHGGTCVWKINQIPSFVCDCALGYTGRLCQQQLPECDSAPCKDHGDCVSTRKGFICVCKGGFKGRLCEKRTVSMSNVNTLTKDAEIHIAINKENVIVGEYTFAIIAGMLIVITVIVSIHCCRVNIRQTQQRKECEEKIINGETVTSLPPRICEVSNQICTETFCCSFCPCVEDENGRQKINFDKILYELKQSRTQLAATQQHLRKQSLDSVWQGPIDQQLESPRNDRMQVHYPEAANGRKVQSERYIPPPKPNIRSFRSLPTNLRHPDKKYSWLQSDSFGEQLRSNDVIDHEPRVLPKQYDQPEVGVPQANSHVVIDNQEYPPVSRSLPGFLQHGNKTSHHSLHSVPSRIHPPLPPLPPHAR